MYQYVLKRLGWAIVTIWIIITITFLMMHAIPGTPFTSEKMRAETLEHLMTYYQLDKPLYVQYYLYLKSILLFDFGPSLKSSVYTVNDMITNGFPVSCYLGVQALLTAIVFGGLIGMIGFLLRHTSFHSIISIWAIVGISIPSFVSATLLIHYVAVEWGLLPVATWETWEHTVLPTLALSIAPMAYIARLMKESLLDVYSQEYIKIAIAKGLSKRAILFRHALRNAALPVITVLAEMIASLITGSFIVEHIFAIPGMGDMFVKGVFNRDYPVIMGSTIFYSAIFIILSLGTDIVYKLIDPRIQLIEGNDR